jgi:hypothetical protein
MLNQPLASETLFPKLPKFHTHIGLLSKNSMVQMVCQSDFVYEKYKYPKEFKMKIKMN